MKVVINVSYGGFAISDEAFERYLTLKGVKFYTGDGLFGSKQFFSVPVEEYLEINRKCIDKGDYTEANALYLSSYDIERNDPVLVQVVEEMEEDAWGTCAQLKVIEIPDDVQWTVQEYDGSEWVAETHRTWS